MDVNLGPGRTGRIGLHQGDDPAELAANFARTYQLDGEMQARLQKLIVKYMEGVVPDFAAGGEAAPQRSPGRTPATDRSKKSSEARSPSAPSPGGRSSGEGLSPGSAERNAAALSANVLADGRAGESS